MMELNPAERRELVRRACEARRNAYAKYSGYRVGAAVLTKEGVYFVGANVENASFGLTNCAGANGHLCCDHCGPPRVSSGGGGQSGTTCTVRGVSSGSGRVWPRFDRAAGRPAEPGRCGRGVVERITAQGVRASQLSVRPGCGPIPASGTRRSSTRARGRCCSDRLGAGRGWAAGRGWVAGRGRADCRARWQLACAAS